jgi:hypothetical protein
MRRFVLIATATVVVAATLGCARLLKLPSSKTYSVAMRDGTRLATDVYFPNGRGHRMPVILIRNTYNKGATANGVKVYPFLAKTFTEKGYAVVVQDTRGRFASAGVDSIFRTDGAGPNQDGYDTIDWITRQNWSDGNVGMWGMSALGITSQMAVASGHPALKAAYVVMCASNLYNDVFYPGGVYRKNLVDKWVSNQGRADFLPALYNQSSYSEYWEAMDLSLQAPNTHTAVYQWGGWFDVMSIGQTNGFRELHERGGSGARGRQMLVMGPWSHHGTGKRQGEIVFPRNGKDVDPAKDALLWFESRLRGVATRLDSVPAVRYYLMGASEDSSGAGNRWMDAPIWPPPESRSVAYHLRENGRLSLDRANAVEEPQSYSYDPQNPVPTKGGLNLFKPIGPFDVREIEARPDVLSFTTEPLAEPVAIAGNVRVKLWASSSAEDTDFMAMLCDVYPDGRSVNILDGAIRARHRESLRQEQFMTPGTPYEFDIDLWDTAIVFEQGHSIRVNISSSNAPRFQPNPNTATPFHSDTVGVVANNTVYHDRTRPSALILPVIPSPDR